jgi:hypothetical protein
MSENQPEYDPDEVGPETENIAELTRQDLVGDTEFEPLAPEDLAGEDAPVRVEPDDEDEDGLV